VLAEGAAPHSAEARATAVREAFARAGYDEERVAVALRVDPPASAAEALAGARRLGEDDPLRTLVELFLAGVRVERVRAEAALDLESARALGLIAVEGEHVSAPFAVVEWQALLVAHDHDRDSSLPADHVTGINNATRTLAALTVRRPVSRALDIGTGSGAQALLAAAHADSVVATDVTERSLRIARLNLELNGLDAVELREGSFFEPVEGERFDLIVSNPPFVVSPDTELVFRDGGLGRDGVSRLVVTELAGHLEPGGFASTLVCWAHREDGDWSHPLRDWLAGSGCDAFVVRYAVEDALEYALKWAAPDAVERWLAYYADEGLESFSTGGVVLRRRADAGEGWFAPHDAETGPTGAGGEQLLRIFAARDFAGELLDERLTLVPHLLNERLAWRDGSYRSEQLALALEAGVGLEVELEPGVLPTLFALDGSRPLRDLPAGEASLPTVRRLFEAGFVERTA
jgi:methylase of polypeptide subunit release factors